LACRFRYNRRDMLFQGDIQKLHEFIKEYLRFAKFDDTFECFDAEVKTKIVSKKLDELAFDPTSDETPELLRVVKGTSATSLLAQRRQEQLHEATEKYLDLLAGARQIFTLAVKLLSLCEASKAVGASEQFMKEKEAKPQVDRLRQAMVKYFKLVIPEDESPKVAPLAAKELRQLADSIKAGYEQVDSNEAIHQSLVRLRVVWGEQANGLSIAEADRRRWIDGLVEADLFFLKRDLDLFEHLTSRSSARTQTVALALASMVASSEPGVAYLASKEDAPVRYLDIVQKLPENSVAQRFGLALLHKLSYNQKLAVALLDAKAETFTAQFLASYKPEACHSFLPIFHTALAFNLFANPLSWEKVSRFSARYAPFLGQLLEFFKRDLPPAAHQNILELFRHFLVEREVYFRDLMVECKAQDSLRVLASSLQSLFKGRLG